MKRNVLAKSIKQILSSYLRLENNYFSRYSNDGENLLLTGDLKIDLLDKFEILNKIEEKHSILINDEKIIQDKDMTVGQYIDLIFNEIKK